MNRSIASVQGIPPSLAGGDRNGCFIPITGSDLFVDGGAAQI
jgi:hypothetical protein